jgi:inhibitor of KinA
MEFSIHPLGDNAVTIELGKDINLDTHKKVEMLTAFFEEHPIEWMIEYIPAFTTVTVFYNPVQIISIFNEGFKLPYDYVCEQLKSLLSEIRVNEAIESRVIEIPVCYGNEFGPDLEYVAKSNGLTPEEVIDIHSNGDYLVYMIGFAPGFPYIGGMNERIATPRRESPRLTIPAGTVGIAGKQTGMYPIETPGGWQLIGKTPLRLFRPDESSPSLLRAGDKIKFKPITYQVFQELEEER